MPTPRPLPDLEGVSHEFVDVSGLRMHVAVAGPEDGEPLVLLHGWPQHWYAWRRLIGPLSERYRVYCPDLRGFGWTDAPPGSYEKAELAADVIALLDVLGLERVRLAGHDWGGFVGFLVCFAAPERVSHFAAAGINHPWVKPEPGIGAGPDDRQAPLLHDADRVADPRRPGRPPRPRLHPGGLPAQRRRPRPRPGPPPISTST